MPEVFAALAFQFDLDPCSPGQDVVPWITATEHYTEADDGLSKDWHGSVWMNCPWNGDMSRWITKFIDHGNGVAMLPFYHSIPRAPLILLPHAPISCVQRIPATTLRGIGLLGPNTPSNLLAEDLQLILRCEAG